MAIVTLGSAAFAGTTTSSATGFIGTAANDTVVPTDTTVPEQKDTTPAFALTETPDTVIPQQKDETPKKEEGTPEKEEGKTQLRDTVVPTDTLTPSKDEPAKNEPVKDEPVKDEPAK